MDPNDRLAQRREAKKSYCTKPRFRKASTLQRVLGASFGVPVAMVIVLSYAIPVLDPLIGRVGILSVFAMLTLGMLSGVLFVCTMALTGPVYKNQIDTTTNNLETWGFADRFAAAVISALAVVAVAWVANRFLGGIPH